MAKQEAPKGAQSVDSMMAGFLSAEELQRIGVQHAAERTRNKDEFEVRELDAKRQRIAMFKERRELTPDVVKRAVDRWTVAAKSGATEVEILRFPSELCTDDGRAINNGEPDWGRTLVGLPAQVYEIWSERLRPLGFRLKAYIVDFPNDRPGDVGMFVTWR